MFPHVSAAATSGVSPCFFWAFRAGGNGALLSGPSAPGSDPFPEGADPGETSQPSEVSFPLPRSGWGQVGAAGVPLRALGTWGLPMHRLVIISRSFLRAQLYWGRKASLVLRLLYYIFPQVDWHLVFVDDYCWVLRCSRAEWDATAILATLLALGVPLSWKKTALSPINTWLGFVVDPITPCVLLAPVKHVIILATLKRLAQGDTFTSKEVEQALGRIQWATETFPPAFLELEEGLHHFGQATQAGSCVGHPFGKTLQPEVLTGISICSHTSMDGGI